MRLHKYHLLLGLAFIFIVHFYSLMRYPHVFVDEAWYASRAWSYIHTGHAFGALDSGISNQFDGYWTIFPLIPTAIQSLGLRLLSVPTLFPLRLISFLFGLLLLSAIYVIAKTLGENKLGLISIFLVSFSQPFFVSAHMARVDIFAAALGYLSIALFLVNRNHRWYLSFLSGLFVGLSIEIHPNSLIYLVTIIGLYVYIFGWSGYRMAVFWSFLVGTSLGIIFYLGIHILPYPGTYYELYKILFSPTRLPPILSFNLNIIYNSFEDIYQLLLEKYNFLLPILLLAAIVLLNKKNKLYNLLLLTCLLLILSFGLLIHNKAVYYTILITPIIDLIIATFIIEVIKIPWIGNWSDYIRLSLVWGITFGYIIANLTVLRLDYRDSYQITQNSIDETIQPQDTIIGPQTYWFGLYKNKYHSWEELIYYKRYAPDSTIEDAFRFLQPDIFIIDNQIEYFIMDNPNSESLGKFHLPKKELETFLTKHGRIISNFDSEVYGHIRVYRLALDY